MIVRFFERGVVDRLRAAQGVISLSKPYSDKRVDAACKRALAFENIDYGAVKTILETGLDQVADPARAFDQFADAYTGGSRFCRNSRDLFDDVSPPLPAAILTAADNSTF